MYPNNINKNNKKKIKGKRKVRRKGREGEREKREKNFCVFFLSSLLSKVYENWTVGFCWSKRQS